MRIEQQPAYVLHARAYRETSLLLECLTREHGRLGVVARGVRGERSRLRRAQLEPFQPLVLDLLLRGELATLTAVEVVDTPARLSGDAGLAGLYLNELVVRLTGRQDPHPLLFDAYARTLARLAAGESLAWSLRRFERDLLEAIGYGLQLQHDADTGEAIEPAACYRYVAEQGAMRCAAGSPRALRGSDLLALEQDEMPDSVGLKELRDMMREVIRFHLGGGELRAWRVLAMAVSRRP
ncbi:DNA repair protein RecO [Rhodanobacter sp. FW510-R12]|uniref:DNA repair protein RecO n=1 Tax=unclassified Rhodanobacter TaxID=2621553 RepID=UPI0007A9C14A|nr:MULTISPECIES: DNA repair protein RecO [unclassified Rhodanobacter]KZC17296.1 DNA repair protein RecO [Rhodanobacter sp. FW104-R8]KZC26241.1 DNA repair protein RecO [Rhodanobacter sp. FW510-T8]KZC29349.1 DNA repair protein RecO [Rhodanobacter sp. FW510-R10]